MSRFLDKRFWALEPYVPGEQPQTGQAIKLNTNESPYSPAPGVAAAVAGEAAWLNLYPDPEAKTLKAALAETLGVEPGQVFLGNGSDEILAFIFQALCPAGVAFADITYGFYRVYAALYGLDAKVVPLREDFTLAPQDYTGLEDGRTIVLANPNAPTGLGLPRAAIQGIISASPQSLVVVDEAYVDFGAESALPLLKQHDNLMVVGTFSKSRSLAGGRLGYAVASPALVEDLERIKFSFNPYNLNRMTMAAGLAALEDTAYFEDCRTRIMATRQQAKAALEQLGFECTASQANFLFARHPRHSAEALYTALKARGILVRWFNQSRICQWLRITIGTPAQIQALQAALAALVQG